MDSGKGSWSKCFWGDIFITKYVNGSIMWPGDYHTIWVICFWKLRLLPKFMQWRNATSFLSPILFSEELQKSLPWSSPSCVKIRLSPFGSPFFEVQNFNTINSKRSNQDKNSFSSKNKSSMACRALIRFFSNDTNALNITLKMISHDHLQRNHENCTFGGKRSCANAAVLRGI